MHIVNQIYAKKIINLYASKQNTYTLDNMPIKNHSVRDLNSIRKLDGSLLAGERDMYMRIVEDCEKSPLTWHMFYDLSLNFNGDSRQSIQIDFLLLSIKGAIIVEVKGGIISIHDGNYCYEYQGITQQMSRTPFKQADTYKWALVNHHILSMNEIYIDTVCAFPHTHLDSTAGAEEIDQRYKLWTIDNQSSGSDSFADFCLTVLDYDKEGLKHPMTDLTENQLNLLVARLAPTILSTSNYSETSVSEILNWLRISNLDTLKSLSKNNRIFIEGGPGTGKTTIAKGYIKMFSEQKGLYLCWNKLLQSRIQYLLKEDGLTSCDVMQYGSFLMRLTGGKITYADIEGPSDVLTEKIIRFFNSHTVDIPFIGYNYIIVDEIHDILDKGVIEVLDHLASMTNCGLSKGRYLVFFDNEQGYNSEARELEDLASVISQNSAIYCLLDNKRVRTNLEIVQVASKVKDLPSYYDLNPVLDDIENKEDYPISIHRFYEPKDMLKYIKQLSDDLHEKRACANYILLAHSSLKRVAGIGKKDIYQIITELKNVSELTTENINTEWDDNLQFTSILSYKGLENHHIILALKKEDYFKCFELYIGMTRAIVSLKLLILE